MSVNNSGCCKDAGKNMFDRVPTLPPLPVDGTFPENYEVERDDSARIVRLKTRFYEVTHDLAKGGAISAIVLLRGTGQNMLTEPISCSVTTSDWKTTLSDVNAPATECEILREGKYATLVMISELRPATEEAPNPGVKIRTVYEYRWGYIRVKRQFLFPDTGFAVAQIMAHQWKLRPDISHFGVRNGTPACDPTHCGESKWGHLDPGRANDYPYWDCNAPRHVVFGNPGREGIEWFMSSDLAQWTYGVCGETGHGWLSIGSAIQPRKAVEMQVCAIKMPREDLQKKKAVFKGKLTLDYRIGIPIISGRAAKPFIHESFNRNNWPKDEAIKKWAANGVKTAHFHHDGDTFHDGLFWRDGSYPPFDPQDMAEFDRVLRTCRENGIRATTYFSNKELHPTTDIYKDRGEEWARLPDGKTQVHNLYEGDEYGAQMCLRSGWSDSFKKSVERVSANHKIDGVYYDWNQAIFCNNPTHSDRKCPDGYFDDRGGLFADLKDSPVAHWDIDELIELMEWTREFVGPDGLAIIHNTMSPCMATENFASYVLGMEWGSGLLSDGVPKLRELPFEWNFVGARSRGVITGGCIDKKAPVNIYRKRNLQCLLTGVAPWRASALDIAMFSPLKELDIEGCRFLDWRYKSAALSECSVKCAAYDREDGMVLLLANLSDKSVVTNVKLCANVLLVRDAAQYRIADLSTAESWTEDRVRLFESGIELQIEANSCRFLKIDP